MLKRLIRDDRGNALTFVAVALPLILGCAGLAVDTIQWTLAKRQLQQAADSAAMAGSYALIQGSDLDYAVERVIDEQQLPASQLTVEASRPLDQGDGDPYAAEVRLSAHAPLSFTGLFLREPFSIAVEARSTVVKTGEYCVLAIGSSDEPGIVLEPDSRVQAECGLASNSSSAKGVVTNGNSSIDATRITSFGGSDVSPSGATRVRAHGLRQEDPLQDTDAPPVPNSGCPNVTVNAGGGPAVSLAPGCYGNIVINGKAWLEPGEYILNRGSLVVGATGRIECNGCTIVLTSANAAADPGSVGKVKIHSRATVKLEAPKDGPNQGLLIYQDRRAGREVVGQESRIGGSSFSEMIGLVYMPSQTLRVDGRMAPELGCARFIGRRIIIEGRVEIDVDCPQQKWRSFAGTEVKLVG